MDASAAGIAPVDRRPSAIDAIRDRDPRLSIVTPILYRHLTSGYRGAISIPSDAPPPGEFRLGIGQLARGGRRIHAPHDASVSESHVRPRPSRLFTPLPSSHLPTRRCGGAADVVDLFDRRSLRRVLVPGVKRCLALDDGQPRLRDRHSASCVPEIPRDWRAVVWLQDQDNGSRSRGRRRSRRRNRRCRRSRRARWSPSPEPSPET